MENHIKNKCTNILGNEPLLVLNGQDIVEIKTIEELYTSSDNKLNFFCNLSNLNYEYAKVNYKIWSHKGWMDINYVIRHKNNKKIYRIFMPDSICDVAEGEFLLKENEEKAYPCICSCLNKEKLLTHFPTDFNCKDVLSKKFLNKSIFISKNKKDCQEYFYFSKK